MLYHSKNKFSYVWLKGEFRTNDDPSRYYGISTGRIRLCDTIYINEKEIGKISPGKVNWNPYPRNYVFPENVLKTGKNSVYIQLGVYEDQYCGISDHVLIQTESEFNRAKITSDLLYKRLPFGIMILFFGFIIHGAISFFWNRKEKSFIYYSLLLFDLIIAIFTSLPSYRVIDFELYFTIRISLLIGFSILVILIIQSIRRLYLSNYNRIIIPLLLLFSLIILLSTYSSYSRLICYIIGGLHHIIVIPFYIFYIYIMYLKNRRLSTLR